MPRRGGSGARQHPEAADWWSRNFWRGRRSQLHRAVRRAATCCRWLPRRTTRPSSTATRARTPAAWAPTATATSSPRPDARDSWIGSSARRSKRPGFTGFLYAGPDDDGRRPEGAGVQRAAGRSGDAAAHAPHGIGLCAGAGGSGRRAKLGSAKLEWRQGPERLRGAGLGRLPGRVSKPARTIQRNRGLPKPPAPRSFTPGRAWAQGGLETVGRPRAGRDRRHTRPPAGSTSTACITGRISAGRA
jgi:hypothetical protein